MSIPQEALNFENRSVGVNGEPTLAKAYKILSKLWEDGDRDRELGLHLIFLAWYGIIEPGWSTGFSETDGISIETNQELNKSLEEVHAYFEPTIRADAEMLYAVGLAADMFHFMFEDVSAWEKRAGEYRELYRSLAPNGLDPEIFRGRGAYGEYYEMQAKTIGGF